MVAKRRRNPTGGRKTAPQSAADINEEYRALRRRAFRIVREMHGTDRWLARHATSEWEKLVDDFRAWVKRNRVEVVTRAVKSASPDDGVRRFGTSPDGCEALVGGAMANGQTLECILRRYNRSRRECVYDCVVFDRAGRIVT